MSNERQPRSNDRDVVAAFRGHWLRFKRRKQIRDHPVIHLINPWDEDTQLVESIAEELSTKKIPHTTLTSDAEIAEDAGDTTAQLREALDEATRTFKDGAATERIGPLRFPRFHFLNYLLKQNPVERHSLTGYVIREHETRGLLSPRTHAQNSHDQSQQGQSDSSAKDSLRHTWQGLLETRPLSAIASLVLVVGFGYIGLRLFHRVLRWIMRQPYLAPRQNGNMHKLVQRLLVSQHEDPTQVRKFLVHAFLEDLAENYTRRLKWLPKDSYPVLLVRNAHEGSLGALLIRLINDVRNGTGASDPLLVIATGREPLNQAETPEESPDSLETWNNRLKQARRRRSPVAWYLPLQTADVRQNPDLLSRKSASRGRELRHSRLFRAVPVLTVFALVVSLGVTEYALKEQHCGRWWPWSDRTDVRVLDGECVGYSAGEHVFTDADSEKPDLVADLARAQRRVFANNADVNERAANTDMPTYTVVYLGIFTADPGQASSLAGTAEELRGLAAAQEQMLEYGSAVRVHLANGGSTMGHAGQAAEDIVERAEQDPSLVAVAGMGGSWGNTRTAIHRLGRAGLPMIGTTTSAEALAQNSELFHQIPPGNRREAEVVAHYLSGKPDAPEHVQIYHSAADADPSNLDLYSEDLAVKTKQALERRGIRATLVDEKPIVQSNIDCNAALFYADRSAGLDHFLYSVQNACEADSFPHLLASDDTSKYVLGEELSKYREITLDYVSFVGPPTPNGADGPQVDSAEQRAYLAYDAVYLVHHAVNTVLAGQNPGSNGTGAPTEPIGPATVWRGLAEVDLNNVLYGSSGDLAYWQPSGSGGGVHRQIPVDGTIAIRRITAQEHGTTQPQDLLVCRLVGADPDCPTALGR
ncbi:ABC transporter substrate-binding protein [Salinifilum ghardaiensis]